MMHGAGRCSPVSALGFSVILCCAASGCAQSRAPATPPGFWSTLTCTVRSVDARARTLDVITGTGPALRVARFSCGERIEVKTLAGNAPLAGLKPGGLIRVEYTKGADGMAAKAIEALPWPEARGAR